MGESFRVLSCSFSVLSNGNDRGRSRFPEGMTERKATATATARATATATARATATATARATATATTGVLHFVQDDEIRGERKGRSSSCRMTTRKAKAKAKAKATATARAQARAAAIW